MNTRHRIITLALLAVALCTSAQVGDLPRSTPAEQGIDAEALTNFFDAILQMPATDIHHVMVARHGTVVAEMHPAPYRATDAHTLYSESKTVVSLGVGIAVGENRLRVTDRVAPFFAESLPTHIGDYLARLTIDDLLTMRSGIATDWTMRNCCDDWERVWLAKPVDAEPGTRYQYDSMCTFLLSGIVQRVVGTTLLEYLRPRLFDPLHITQVGWELSPSGVNTGGWGLYMQAESQLKIGLLMLAGGSWQGRQLVPAEWIAQATTPRANMQPDQAPTESNQGYGYQIWRCTWPGSYRADGAFGQYVVCVPDADLVVVINEASGRGHDVLGCIWKYLMPGVHADGTTVAGDARHQQRLERLCASAALTTRFKSRTKKAPQGVMRLDDNRLGIATVQPTTSGVDITYADQHSEHVALQPATWAYTTLNGFPPYSIEAHNRYSGLNTRFEVAAQAGWTARDVWTLRMEYVNWISGVVLDFDTRNSQVVITCNYDRNHPQTVKYTNL